MPERECRLQSIGKYTVYEYSTLHPRQMRFDSSWQMGCSNTSSPAIHILLSIRGIDNMGQGPYRHDLNSYGIIPNYCFCKRYCNDEWLIKSQRFVSNLRCFSMMNYFLGLMHRTHVKTASVRVPRNSLEPYNNIYLVIAPQLSYSYIQNLGGNSIVS